MDFMCCRCRAINNNMMEFCPTCGNMLRYELPNMDSSARFFCLTCPYVCPIENRVTIKRHQRLVKKAIDPIFTEEDFKDMNTTTSVSCKECNHNEVSLRQIQIRSADEPMTEFYRCTKCKFTWREN